MAFSETQAPATRLVGIAFVVLLHALLIYTLVTGLDYRAIEVVRAPIEARIIEEAKPPPPEAPPPPSPQLAPPPPAAFVSPPEVHIEMPPPPPPGAPPPPSPQLAPPPPAFVPPPEVHIEMPPPPPEAPPPPSPELAPPPPAFAPPPEVHIEKPTPALKSTAIPAVTPEKPIAPPPPQVAVPVRAMPRLDLQRSAQPEYPPVSRRLGEQGTAVIEVLVGVDGRVLDAKLLQSSGFDRLDQAALAGARANYRFIPGTVDGKPQPMWFTFKFNWKLQ
jgi:periplasmic protein TonB